MKGWNLTTLGTNDSQPLRLTKKGVVVVLGTLAAVAVAVAATMPSEEDTATQTAALACVQVVEASREYVAGTRSGGSLLNVLRDNEGPARDAASEDPKYAPIAEAIVGAQAELLNGQPGQHFRLLIRECG